MKTEKELRELEEWIAVNVMGWRIYKTTREWQEAGSPTGRKIQVMDQSPHFDIPKYTTNRVDAMLLLEECLQGSDVHIELSKTGCFHITDATEYAHCIADSNSLSLSIALFAKQLFKKGD